MTPLTNYGLLFDFISCFSCQKRGIPLYVSKYIGLLRYAGVSGSTTDFDTSRQSKALQQKKK